jgi:tetratricopeptide (TPR) repeat protein
MDPVTEPPPLETAASTSALVAEAWRRIERADYLGARVVSQQAVDRQDADLPEALAALGGAWEADDHPETALDLYRKALEASGPDGQFADHMRFRIAEANGNLGHPGAALADLRRLERSHRWEPADQSKIDLVQAIFELQDGKLRRGRRHARAALGAAAGTNAFYQAKAHVAIARSYTDEAAALPFAGPDRTQVRRLTRRAELLVDAEREVVAAIQLKEPEWILDGMLVLGGGFEALADDLRNAPAPQGFDDQLRGLWTAQLSERSAVLYTKADNAYSRALDFAAEQQWRSRRIALLDARSAGVKQKINEVGPKKP